MLQETNHRYQWLRWIIERNLPITEVDNTVTRSMSKWLPISSKSLKQCMQTVARNVRAVVGREMGSSFGLMFDGWPHGSMHYVRLYSVHEVMGDRRERLLSLSPLDDGSQTAEAHVSMIKSVLSIYNKTLAMVVVIVGDNCSSTQKIATLLGVPLVGCASHRFNLADNRFLSDYEPELSALNNLMIHLRHCNNAATLAKFTDLQPIKRNATRWLSTYVKVARYVRIRDAIRQVEAVEEYVPSGVAQKKLVALLAELEMLDTV